MAELDRDRISSNQTLQESLDGSDSSFFASYGLIGAIVVLGGLGYVADRVFNTAPWLVIAGLACGLLLGFYGLIHASRSRQHT